MEMWSIIKLSWKNVWRSPMRSGVVIISVILATWSGIFVIAFTNGMTVQFVRDQLENYTSHIQVHNPDFVDEKLPGYYIENPDSVMDVLRSKPFVRELAARSIANGLASSATGNFGVTIMGIDPAAEPRVSGIHTFITEGNYLEDPARNPVIIGSDLARRLSLSLRSRLVLTFQDIDGNITAGAFRISGIFRTPNTPFDEGTVLVNREDLNRLIGRDGMVHEIAVLVDDYVKADEYAAELNSELSVTARSWGDISPTLRYLEGSMSSLLYFIMGILIIALCFGIVNTMLMAVLERTHELGMLRAIGMNKRRSFAMIMIETLFLTMVGAPVGLLLSWLSVTWIGAVGIDLGIFAEGLEAYGFSSMVYPELQIKYYLNITAFMFLAALFAAIFPAFKALKLNPVEAIRKR